MNEMIVNQSEKVVFIMGAGASCDDKIPQQSDLLGQIIDGTALGYIPSENNKYSQQVKELIRVLFSECSPNCRSTLPDLETVFNVLESSIEREIGIGKIKYEEVIAYRDKLIDAIMLAVRKVGSAVEHDVACKDPNSPYTILGQKLYNSYKGKSNNLAFVTFNYDICLDRVLLSMFNETDEKETVDLDYGLELGSYLLSRNHDLSFQRPRDPKVLLLRPHGSINWLLCQSCGRLFTTSEYQAAEKVIRRGMDCDLCGGIGALYPYIIHPSYDRVYMPPSSLIWERIFEVLVEAQKWCFIGYSLPNVDRYFQWVLLRAKLARKDGPPEIYVIDHESEDDLNSTINYRALKGRYNKLLGVPAHNFESKGFKSFLQKLHFVA